MPNDDPEPRHGQAAHGHQHHGHRNDQGIAGALRYLRWLPEMWRSEINDAVVELVDPRPGERVVDIGAGMGAGAVRAAAAGARVVAVEPTPFMRSILRARRAAGRRRDRVEVADGAAEHLPVADGSIDAIWAVNTMHHWADLERGVSEIARALRPGGRVLLVDEDFTDPSHPDHARFGTDRHEDHGFTTVDADRLADLLRTAGLTDSTRRRAGSQTGRSSPSPHAAPRPGATPTPDRPPLVVRAAARRRSLRSGGRPSRRARTR